MSFPSLVHRVHAKAVLTGWRASPRHLNVFVVECLKGSEAFCLALAGNEEIYMQPAMKPVPIRKEQVRAIYRSVLGFFTIALNGPSMPGEWSERIRVMSSITTPEYLEVMAEDLDDGANLMDQLLTRCTFMIYTALEQPPFFDHEFVAYHLMEALTQVGRRVVQA